MVVNPWRGINCEKGVGRGKARKVSSERKKRRNELQKHISIGHGYNT